MRKKTIPMIIVAFVLLVSVTLLVTTVGAKKSFTDQDMVIWELSKVEIVDPGTPVEIAEGDWVRGYTLEGKAKAKGGNVIPEGYFRLEIDSFAPYEDMGVQKAGWWYVTGSWTITKKNADPEMLKTKHNPGIVEGTFIGQLSFDPTNGAGNWTGKAILPMALAAGNWSKGEGTLTLGENLEGDLFLSLERWPEVK